MADININEYVRTDNGEIHKVEDIEDLRIHIKTEKIMFRSWVDDYYGAHKEDRFIVKHSPNIIDLIEVGDYVNGEIVIDIGERSLYLGYADDNEHYSRISIDESEINSIVTKEMFNQVKYEV